MQNFVPLSFFLKEKAIWITNQINKVGTFHQLICFKSVTKDFLFSFLLQCVY